jgi:hypothetical protein
LCKSIFDEDLPKEEFDLVTMIGSAITETGNQSYDNIQIMVQH